MAGNDNETLSGRDHLSLLTERELAAHWRKSVRTLQRWRAEGFGPAYIYIGGTVCYRVGDVLAFENRMRRGGGAVE